MPLPELSLAAIGEGKDLTLRVDRKVDLPLGVED